MSSEKDLNKNVDTHTKRFVKVWQKQKQSSYNVHGSTVVTEVLFVPAGQVDKFHTSNYKLF